MSRRATPRDVVLQTPPAATRRFVLTGGPGAGKTTLLAELAARGCATVGESARAIIVARVAAGLPPRPDPVDFAREILRRDIESYLHPPQSTGPVFHDRGAVEALAMVHGTSPLPEDELKSALAAYAFQRTVFILPPWEAIYVNDSERDHSFAHACRVHEHLVHWYGECGYLLDEVPRVPVAQRADHVLRAIADEA